MSTLFLIGNGFDLNCGMRTKYEHVYEEYIKEPSNTDVIKNFKNNISKNIETWSDFEMAMASYAQVLKSESEFLECVRDFSSFMEKYLLKEEKLFNENISNEQILKAVVDNANRSFTSFYEGISPNVDRKMRQRAAGIISNIDIISFNYTNVFDNIFNSLREIYRYAHKEIVHIHGNLQGGPVFGVDNINQINVSYELTRKGRRAFIKPVFNNAFDQLRIDQAMNKFTQATTICAFGMSLGESDLTWRKRIIEWLKADNSRHLFIYMYDLISVNYSVESEKMDIEDDAKESLLVAWGLDIEDQILDQIHIPCGKNIFNIKEVITVEREKINDKKAKEIRNKIEKGERFINESVRNEVV